MSEKEQSSLPMVWHAPTPFFTIHLPFIVTFKIELLIEYIKYKYLNKNVCRSFLKHIKLTMAAIIWWNI